jgi:hypothetical protein
MDEINYAAVVLQLQHENEMLRLHMRSFEEMRQAVIRVPNLLESFWQKIAADKMKLLIGLMIVYWFFSIGFMFYDRIKGAIL